MLSVQKKYNALEKTYVQCYCPGDAELGLTDSLSLPCYRLWTHSYNGQYHYQACASWHIAPAFLWALHRGSQ